LKNRHLLGGVSNFVGGTFLTIYIFAVREFAENGLGLFAIKEV